MNIIDAECFMLFVIQVLCLRSMFTAINEKAYHIREKNIIKSMNKIRCSFDTNSLHNSSQNLICVLLIELQSKNSCVRIFFGSYVDEASKLTNYCLL